MVALSGDNRHFVALDYSAGSAAEPKVVFWQTSEGAALDVAPSMQAFLEGLCDEESLPAPVAVAAEEPVEEEQFEEFGLAALLGDDLEDDDEDNSFQGGAEDEDEEIVDGEEDDENEAGKVAVAEVVVVEEDEHSLPPGKRGRRGE